MSPRQSMRLWTTTAGVWLILKTALCPAQPPIPLPESIQGADNPIVRPASAETPAPIAQSPNENRQTRTGAPIEKFGDPAEQSTVIREMIFGTQRGAEWMFRANQIDGRFLPGFHPALRRAIQQDSSFHQAMAAFAMARAARFTGEARYDVRAQQAILTLMGETEPAANDPKQRHPAQPSVVCNRLGMAGLLVLAICELSEPEEKLLEQAEQLCRFIVSRQRSNGSMQYLDDASEAAERLDPEGMRKYPGIALYALARSARVRPAEWKLTALRRALPYYMSAFSQQPHPEMAAWQINAYSEAYLAGKDAAFSKAVFSMTDWLIKLQYSDLDPRHPFHRGGFRRQEQASGSVGMPNIDSALFAHAIASACQVTRHVPDTDRHTKYRTSLIRSVQFVVSLQYREENTQHFTSDFRAALLGGFHSSPEDGALRIEHTALGVAMLARALESGSF